MINRFLLIPAIFLAWAFSSMLGAQVVINRTEPVVERREFDPRDPPSTMPKLNPNEAAVTQSYFQAESRVGGHETQRKPVAGGYQSSIAVESVRVTLRLRVTIWLPQNAVDKIARHEEGHKDIALHYYENAEQVARELAVQMIGKTVSGVAESYSDAADKALQQAAVDLGQRYLNETDVPSGRAQALYDQMTQHGTNGLSEAAAVTRAIEQATTMPAAPTSNASVR